VPRRHRLRLDLANTVFITMYTCTRRCPKCQPPRLVTRPLGPSVQASRPPFTTPGPSARHVLLDLHITVDHRLRALHLHTTSQKTCTHSFRHDRVSHHSTYFVDHIDNHSSQNEYTRYLSTLCSQVLDIVWRIRLVLADLACKGAVVPTGRDSAVVRTYSCTVALGTVFPPPSLLLFQTSFRFVP
jgi:hypothetical protein